MRTRFVKSRQEVDGLARIYAAPSFLDIRTLRIPFETDPEAIAEIIPPPLGPADRPSVSIAVSEIGRSNCVGAFNGCTVNIACTYQGEPGQYCLMMPMTTDTAVLFGRELFAEPKKLADITLAEVRPNQFVGTVTRHGITFIE